MKRYLVGGAIRDELLGLPVRERDWVLTGVTPEQLDAAGYLPVGKDFPVFLHPQTKEEHALARTERKTAPGYKGFSFHTGPEVTLEDDLVRRDLTINAIARGDDGVLVDPYGGQRDLDARVLRHVSEAFCEDPVRILRLARFHARFASLGFSVADETLALMRKMVADGEVDHLVPERVWQETKKALMTDAPGRYFRTLQDCGALARIMPELSALEGVPQRADYHPEVDTLVHVLMCVDTSAALQLPLETRYAVLVHDLGKGATPQEEWPSHRMHDMRGVPLVEKFSERLRVPAACRDLALVHTKEHLIIHQALELRPSTLLGLVERIGGFAKGERFEQVLQASICDARGRLGFEDSAYEQADYLRAARVAANEIQAAQVMADGISGAAIGEALKERRTRRLKEWKEQRKAQS
ncbi:multifunctional CCA addition/repair protein [Solimonas sp. K1W22B-7]|uniref:multifunctional CCA addition/repair protein n=1 Tax=Solimonas sp. K1W22B-7 TaxID=2303331 RepID=UPI000E3376AE|nr:multifunctional CCA addition/repair protein [Solimonas sp. K1W22B-7]AXQ31360.1 multifunctional CCA addition/repair protein [Solimonas sp. K1W22B-7]